MWTLPRTEWTGSASCLTDLLVRVFTHIKMGRPAQPEEIAPAYVFLASPQCSSYITGEILPIIGGYTGG